MPSWRRGNGSPRSCGSARLCSGRFLKRALWSLCLTSTFAGAQIPTIAPLRKASTHRVNELTLAGLRPGRDTLSRAVHFYRNLDSKSSTKDFQTVWKDPCRKQVLAVDFDTEKRIQVIRAGAVPLTGDCIALPTSPWRTGLGLRVRTQRQSGPIVRQPDSRSS